MTNTRYCSASNIRTGTSFQASALGNTSTSKSVSAGTIAGAIIGSLIGVAILLGIIIYAVVFRRRRSGRKFVDILGGGQVREIRSEDGDGLERVEDEEKGLGGSSSLSVATRSSTVGGAITPFYEASVNPFTDPSMEHQPQRRLTSSSSSSSSSRSSNSTSPAPRRPKQMDKLERELLRMHPSGLPGGISADGPIASGSGAASGSGSSSSGPGSRAMSPASAEADPIGAQRILEDLNGLRMEVALMRAQHVDSLEDAPPSYDG
jgi:hypothetical protein